MSRLDEILFDHRHKSKSKIKQSIIEMFDGIVFEAEEAGLEKNLRSFDEIDEAFEEL